MRASAHIGRIGLLAATLGIGAAVAGGTAIAGADTPGGTTADSSAASQGHPAARKPALTRASSTSTAATATSATATSSESPGDSGSQGADDPGSAPPSSLAALRSSRDRTTAAEQSIDTAVDQDEPEVDVEAPEVADVPSPTDETPTAYGDIGKWMLSPDGDISDYGGVPFEGRTVLEPVNVIIVDPTSTSASRAASKLNTAMRRAGFPPRAIHSTGFRGLIDGQRYRQQPRGFLVGYSDDSFLRANNHGRIFGPDPVETSTGYVWTGAFSREDWVFSGGLPRHGFVSANQARDALAADLIASGRARDGGRIALDNMYNTDGVTTGDHDGYAVVLILNDLYVTAAAPVASPKSRTCAPTGYSTPLQISLPCGALIAAEDR